MVVRRQGAMVAALAGQGGLRYLSPSRLDRVETWWAMTIHRSQGSEYPHAVVSLPAAISPILTRELLYTAVTRGRRQLTIVGTEEALRAAIGSAGGTGLGPAPSALAAVTSGRTNRRFSGPL